MEKLKAEDLVNDVIDILEDRNGFDNWWNEVDGELRDEIFKELVALVQRY